MGESEYVPQVGDIVSGLGNGGQVSGIYIGEQSWSRRGVHVVLGEDGQKCTVVTSVSLLGYTESNAWGRDPLYEEAMCLLAEICESMEYAPSADAPLTSTYRAPAGSASGMSRELAAWWGKARQRMAKVCFVDSWRKIKGARENVAAIGRLGGVPHIEIQERVESAEHDLQVRRARVLHVFADQIAAARKQHNLDQSPETA
jgi:hypothetical protein